MVNSFILFKIKQLNPDTKMSHLHFHTAITLPLVQMFSEHRFAPQLSLPAPASAPTAATTAAELLPVPVTAPVLVTAPVPMTASVP